LHRQFALPQRVRRTSTDPGSAKPSSESALAMRACLTRAARSTRIPLFVVVTTIHPTSEAVGQATDGQEVSG